MLLLAGRRQSRRLNISFYCFFFFYPATRPPSLPIPSQRRVNPR